MRSQARDGSSSGYSFTTLIVQACHRVGGDFQSIKPEGNRRVEKLDHIQTSLAYFIARDVLLRLVKATGDLLLAKPLFLPCLDELSHHPAIATIVNAFCHTPSHQFDVKTVHFACDYTNLM